MNETRPETGQARLDVPSAALRLGISEDAVRKRIHRGKLAAEKSGGQWFVLLGQDTQQDTGQDRRKTGQDTGRDRTDTAIELARAIAERDAIRDERDYLRQRIDRLERMHAGLIERIPELPHGPVYDDRHRHDQPETPDATERDDPPERDQPHDAAENVAQRARIQRIQGTPTRSGGDFGADRTRETTEQAPDESEGPSHTLIAVLTVLALVTISATVWLWWY